MSAETKKYNGFTHYGNITLQYADIQSVAMYRHNNHLENSRRRF